MKNLYSSMRKMDKIKILYLVIILESVLILGVFSMYRNEKVSDKKSDFSMIEDNQISKSKDKECKVVDAEYTISGLSMEPLLKDGKKVNVKEGYYKCNNKVTRGDIIIYQSDSTKGPIIKQVRVLPGDELNIDGNNLIINGEILKNSAGSTYAFSKSEINFLKIYIQKGKMQDGAYFIFGDNVSNSFDSRKIGAVGPNGFIGKVVLKK